MLTQGDAEEYTQALGQVVAGSWRQVALATRLGVPAALGMSTKEWVEQRLGGYVRLSVPERREAVAELLDGGFSAREAAHQLGVSRQTVNDDREVLDGGKKLPPGDDDGGFDQQVEEQSGNFLPLVPDEDTTSSSPPVSKNSGDFEWYTPEEFVKAAANAMGGIDLDPASCAVANETVRAATFYTPEDDGLSQPWFGRVWMNPPYAQPLCKRFCLRLAREYQAGAVTAACVLVNNATESEWFQTLLAVSSAICFPLGRIRFWSPNKLSTAPLQGQAVIFLGRDPVSFKREFLPFGTTQIWQRETSSLGSPSPGPPTEKGKTV
jgi:DNA N-6-adenine-methyltransferase (Dam)/Helix-turn-helix domain